MVDVSVETVPGVIGGRYETVRLIGRGGMGSVWLAEDTLLGRQVALKQITALPGEAEADSGRALREARVAAALNHPNVVGLYDAIEHDDALWLVMEHVSGPTLAQWVRENGPIDPESVAEVGARLASGIEAAHRAGVVHRDIKPANVFMADDGEPKLGDFGTARRGPDDQVTQAGMVTGTPSYMSPEVAEGRQHGEAADVWALGATLYFAVEGVDAFSSEGSALATLHAISTKPPRTPERAGVLEPILGQMLSHNPDRRGSMRDVKHRLEEIAPGRPGAIPLVGAGALATSAGAGLAAAPHADAATDRPADEDTAPHFVAQETGDASGAGPQEPTDEGNGLFGFPGARERTPWGARKGRGALVAGGLAVLLVGGMTITAFTLGDDDSEATPSSTSKTLTPTREEPTTTSTSTSSSTSSSTTEPTSETTTEEVPPPPPPEPEPEPEEPEPTSETEEESPEPAPTTEEPAPEPTSETPEPTTTEPTTPSTTEPTTPTSEPTTPTSEPTTTDPTSEPSTPSSSDSPTSEPTSPTSEPSSPTSDDPPPTSSDPTTPPSSTSSSSGSSSSSRSSTSGRPSSPNSAR